MIVRTSLLALLLAALAGCASGPGIPESTYFRLPPRPAVTPAEPALDGPLVVEAFFADGVHSDQSLLYALDEEGTRLRAYHYQLWVDPPTRLLQRRLIRTLDDARVAPLVVERLAPKNRQYRLTSRIEAFERLPRGEQWVVRVALQVQLERSDADVPLLSREYQHELPADGTSVRDTVRALGAAVDAVYGQLLADLRALPRG